MNDLGKHLLLEVYDGTFEQLNDHEFIKKIFQKGILESKSKILNCYVHQFDPQGCTVLFALAESHVSAHTWPEKGCLSADFYTCGNKDPEIIANYVIEAIKSKKHRIRILNR
tara:strand:+ start:1174 stop:1509 length:336 start_codon:yes stop_codon:yes gene_type:complete